MRHKPSYSLNETDESQYSLAASAPATVHGPLAGQQSATAQPVGAKSARRQQPVLALDLAAPPYEVTVAALADPSTATGSLHRGGVLKPTYLSTLLNKPAEEAQYYDPLDLATAPKQRQQSVPVPHAMPTSLRKSAGATPTSTASITPQAPVFSNSPLVSRKQQQQQSSQPQLPLTPPRKDASSSTAFLDVAAPPSRAPVSSPSASSPSSLVRPQPQRSSKSRCRARSHGSQLFRSHSTAVSNRHHSHLSLLPSCPLNCK